MRASTLYFYRAFTNLIKFLGLLFHSTSKNLTAKCLRSTNVLKYLSHPSTDYIIEKFLSTFIKISAFCNSIMELATVDIEEGEGGNVYNCELTCWMLTARVSPNTRTSKAYCCKFTGRVWRLYGGDRRMTTRKAEPRIFPSPRAYDEARNLSKSQSLYKEKGRNFDLTSLRAYMRWGSEFFQVP